MAGTSRAAMRTLGASDAAAPWRLAAGLLIAGLLHLALVFSVPFPSRPVPASSPAIELTLTGYDSPASSSPRAAGADRAPPPAAPETAGTTETPPRPDNPEAPNPEPIAPPPAEASLAGGSARAAVSEAAAPPPITGLDTAGLVEAVAALAAADDAPPVSGLRILRLDAAVPGGTQVAYYLESWRRKVERIGKLNYPTQARSKGVGGSLRLLVAIGSDGALSEVRVLETSGHRMFDDAAVRIVRLAAPYSPFPPGMRETIDQLEIERTWQFRNSRLSF